MAKSRRGSRRTRGQSSGSATQAKRPQAANGSDEDAIGPARRNNRGFLPEVLDRTVIAIPLLRWFKDPKKQGQIFDVVIDLNLEFRAGLKGARTRIKASIERIIEARGAHGGRRGMSIVGNSEQTVENIQYVFARLDADAIKELVRRDASAKDRSDRAIHHIWPDFPLKTLINKSISTVKADALHNSFAAAGAGIVWAVIDSGIDATHPHFVTHRNLELEAPLIHHDFTPGGTEQSAKTDSMGHGTHVAGIIAGEVATGGRNGNERKWQIVAKTQFRDENGNRTEADIKPELTSISGMAPMCRLLSLKVMDGTEQQPRGNTRGIIEALQYIQQLNGNGRRLLVHGVNMSVGYDFEPEWFGCGQSPLCVEVDRLVRSGVVVVVAAGNSGYGTVDSSDGVAAAGLPLTIDDPGNAESAITVGSTHRDSPHTFGISYFSSKGPTGDGRIKPDLVAPGEKIISCQSKQLIKERRRAARGTIIARYREDSGTSMAAPHVSGVIAAFLSIRREYIGHPEEVKRIFLASATDLNRDRYLQGRGLVDVMRAIQSI